MCVGRGAEGEMGGEERNLGVGGVRVCVCARTCIARHARIGMLTHANQLTFAFLIHQLRLGGNGSLTASSVPNQCGG